jgi:acetyltransferase-like isoleucine patch superfamily enzyme
MARLLTLLRYDWPLHFVLLLTNWLPDNVIFFRIRGILARPFLGSCGNNLRLGRNITFYNTPNIHLGNNTYIALGCVFLANDHIWIEDEVIFGPYCVLASGNHTRHEGSFRYGEIQPGPIRVMKGCWLSAHVVVTANTCIGQGTLVAAGAVASRDIPNSTMVGGVPARLIKNLNDRGYRSNGS